MKKNSAVIIVISILGLLIIALIAYFGNSRNYAVEPPNPQTAVETATSPDVDNNIMQITTTTVLVNELDDNKGLFFLGQTKDDVLSVLNDNGIYYKTSTFSAGDYSIYFCVLKGIFTLFFDPNDLVVGIDVTGYSSVDVTLTRLGLNIGDTYDKLIELYGKDKLVSKFEDDEFKVYEYKFDDHYFEVWSRFNIITAWRVSTQEFL